MSKPDRRCLACRDRKPADAFSSPQARKCMACHATVPVKALSRSCARCGEERPRTDYVPHGRVCAACRQTLTPDQFARSKRPCMRCFEVKLPDEFAWGDGRQGAGKIRVRRRVCLPCEALERAAMERRQEARRATWTIDGQAVRRCSKCREVKDLESSFNVDHHLPDGSANRRYMCRECDRQRIAAYKKRAAAADPVGQREKWVAWKRNWIARNPERTREIQRAHRARVFADPERHAAYLESVRIAYRLRQERNNGRSLDDVRKQRAHLPLPADDFGRLPAPPVVRALESYARREGVDEGSVCALVGIDPRNLFAWRMGERDLIQFDVADRVLTGLGLSWWDVWDANDPAVRAVWEGQVAA